MFKQTYQFTVLLDKRLHRIIPIGEELSSSPEDYSMIVTRDSASINSSNPQGDIMTFKDIKKGTSVIIDIGGVMTPPCEEIIITNPIDANYIVFTTFTSDSFRVVKFNENISTKSQHRLILVNEPAMKGLDPRGGEIMVLVTPTITQNAAAGKTKIPPGTGEFL